MSFIPKYSPADGSLIQLHRHWLPPEGTTVEFYLSKGDGEPLRGIVGTVTMRGGLGLGGIVFVAMKQSEKQVYFGNEVMRWREVDSAIVLPEITKLQELWSLREHS